MRTGLFGRTIVGVGSVTAFRRAPDCALDEARLEHLWAQLGSEGFRRLVNRFAPASKVELERLDSALATGRVDPVRAAAHRLAGFAANFGAARLARLARELEAHPGDAEARVPGLRDAVAASEVALDADVARRCPAAPEPTE